MNFRQEIDVAISVKKFNLNVECDAPSKCQKFIIRYQQKLFKFKSSANVSNFTVIKFESVKSEGV